MGTFIISSLALGHTSPITLNRSGSVVLLVTGVQSKLRVVRFRCIANCAYVRCDVKPTDLDGSGTHQRSHEKTDICIDTYDTKTLWDDFGLRHNIVVSIARLLIPLSDKALNSLSRTLFHMQTFTNCYPLISFIR